MVGVGIRPLISELRSTGVGVCTDVELNFVAAIEEFAKWVKELVTDGAAWVVRNTVLGGTVVVVLSCPADGPYTSEIPGKGGFVRLASGVLDIAESRPAAGRLFSESVDVESLAVELDPGS